MFAGFHSARIGEGPLKWMPLSLVRGYVVQRALLGEFFSPDAFCGRTHPGRSPYVTSLILPHA